MKKVLLALSCLALSAGVFAQTIVSTSVEKRHVVFEEYTGVNCGYCPNGHAMLASYANQNPGTVVINIHQGGYASAYTTQWGNALANQTNLEGYPAFTMNRLTTDGAVANYYGGNYTTDGATIRNQNSPVNIAATAEVDALTRIMTIHVEAYYTADVAQNANMLQVALLQDNIIGYQSNYGGYNPDQIMPDGSYKHMHMLRDMVTGQQWGDEIATNSEGLIPAGTFVEKDYTYTLPATISNEAVKLGDVNLAIFISDAADATAPNVNAPNIWTGIKVVPTYININGNNASITNLTIKEQFGCKQFVSPTVKLRSEGLPITSLTATYKNNTATNDTEHTYTFSGTLNTFAETDVITLEDLPIVYDESNNIVFTITSVNGETVDVSTTAVLTKAAPKEGSGRPSIIIKTDSYASELTLAVEDANGDEIFRQGGYSDGSSIKDTILIEEIESAGCYTMVAYDSYGDGQAYNGANGYVRVYDGAGNRLVNITGSYAEKRVDFKITSMSVGLNDANGVIAQSMLYPNPAVDMTTLAINANNASKAEIVVVDMLGRVAMNLGSYNLVSGDNNITINTSNLAEGTYFVRVITNEGMTSNRLNVVK